MSRVLKVLLIKMADCEDSTLKPSLLAIDGTRIMGELGEADDVEDSIKQSRPDVLILCAGRSPVQSLLDRLSGIVQQRAELALILACPHRDPDLLLGAMRCGVREFIELPTKPEDLLNVLQKILELQPVRKSGGSLILVHGSGGGCGTSTLACNLAVEIARSGRARVALVDLDIYRGQLTAMLDVFPTYTLLDVCRLSDDDLEHARIESTLLKHDSGVRLLARPKELVGDDIHALSRTTQVLHLLIEMFDYVVVDFDMRMDVSEGRIVKMADDFILVSQPVINSVRNASEVIRELARLEFDMDRLRLVLNRVPKKLGSVQIENVEKSLKRNVFWEVPEDYVSVSESLNLGIPLSEHATSSKARCSIRDMALAMIRQDSKEIAGAGKKDGLLKRMFNTNVA